MVRSVRFRMNDGVAVVTLDVPPDMSLSVDVRAGLYDIFDSVDTGSEIKAIVLLGAGLTQAEGNISIDAEKYASNDARDAPTLLQVCAKIEACDTPVVGVLVGETVGGAAQVMLATHYRLALPDARIGLPQVALGLIPGAGGTQRLPRLIGAHHALDMILTGRCVDAPFAKQIGLIDGIVQADPAAGAIAFAQDLIQRGEGPRRTCDRRDHLKNGRVYQGAVAKARATLGAHPLHAPARGLDCVEAAAILPMSAGLAFEADALQRCRDHPESLALHHIFRAEREIDDALIKRDGTVFRTVDPMGKSAVVRLFKAWQTAARYLVHAGATEAEIDDAAVAAGHSTGPFGGRTAGAAEPEIMHSLIAALVVEGAACVAQGAVQRPSDIDALAVHGFGFPRHLGGPMRAAQSIGLIALRRNMRLWAQDSPIWEVPDLMDQAIKDAKGFDI